ncbi:unnamed protein product, partial [Brenthis ino]
MNVENSSEAKHIPTMEPPSYSGPLPQSYHGPPVTSPISFYPGEMTTGVITTQPISQPTILVGPFGYEPFVMTLKEMNLENSSEAKHIPTMEPPSYSGPLPQSYHGPPVISPISFYPGEMRTDVITTQPISQPTILMLALCYHSLLYKCMQKSCPLLSKLQLISGDARIAQKQCKG